MIKYYTSRVLAEKFNINLAKWKRWSREFLPPDPLGGMQSGFARQYHPDQAFTVRLGGHLVADLKFSIPDARQILGELNSWTRVNGLCFNARGGGESQTGTEPPPQSYLVFILPTGEGGFQYIVRGMVSKRSFKEGGVVVVEERYTETRIQCGKGKPDIEENLNMKVLNIGRLLSDFIRSMEISPLHYPGAKVA